MEAIVYLGQKFPGSEPAARGLTGLLKPLPPEKPAAEPTASGGVAPTPTPSPSPSPVPGPGPSPTPGFGGPVQPRNPGHLTKLVEAIVEALGCNGSPVARDTLEQVLAGTFATDDDKVAVEAAIKTLAAHPSEENDALLFRVLSAAEALRPADRAGPWPARDLQPKALELVKPVASSGLRTKLAEWLLANHPGGLDAKEPTCEYLMTADPRNCGAQLVFYKKADTSKEMKATVEQQFLDYSSKAMARYLGIPEEALAVTGGVGTPPAQPAGQLPAMGIGGGAPPGAAPGTPPPGPIARPNQPAGQPTKPAEVNPAPHVASELWSVGFCALLEPQLNTKSLEQQSQLLLLAGTIPRIDPRAPDQDIAQALV